MKIKGISLVAVALLCCFLVGCNASMGDMGVSPDRYDEGYNDGYYNGYEAACEDSHEEFIDELYGIDGYLPVYMGEENIEALTYIVEENNGNQYRPEEYADVVYDYFASNLYNMTSEQIEAFENVLTFCYDAEWIARNILQDIQFPPT